ncbi:MAG: hypothetical protein U1E85_01290 [Rhodocyclaceae bacterium]
MARDLKISRPRMLLSGLAVFAMTGGLAHADNLADPTRPPAFVGADGAAYEGSANRLSSIVLPRQGKAAAVIDGQLVTLGGMVGDARLTRISETGIVLEGPEGIERLYLTPDVEKRVKATKGGKVVKDMPRQQKDKP